METANCNLIDYRGRYYLVFSENRALRIGDRVLTCGHLPVGRILGPAGGWDHENFWQVSNTADCVYLYGPALNVIAACEEEIRNDDLRMLQDQKQCTVSIINGKTRFKDGKIIINL